MINSQYPGWLVGVGFAGVCALAGCSAGPENPGDQDRARLPAPHRAAVESAVSAFGDAFAAADVERLEGLLAGDYLHVNGGSGSVVSRADWLAWVASRHAELESGALVIEVYEVHDLDIRLQGDSALVTGIVESSGVRNGEPFASRLRFTNTWVLSDGRWLRAGFHDSAIPARDG